MGFTVFIILIPLALFLFLSVGGKWLRPRAAGIIGTIGMSVPALLSYYTAYRYLYADASVWPYYKPVTAFSTEWLRFGEKLSIDMGVMLDSISVMMLVVITTVSLMVHIYSLGYMKGERGFQRYYALLSLFSFSMLGLVAATNLFQTYIFWELVGASSYLLIGFYYTKPAAVRAAKKAFIVTRFADLGFLTGILILSYYTGTFDFKAMLFDEAMLVQDTAKDVSFLGLSAATWATSLIFVGAAGKSAMFPLHIWLPDAMEGPTPVSALIHAATMVVAGVFLIARLFPVYIFAAAPSVMDTVMYVGTFTALFAAVIAVTQTDIKRVLAFSTISQIAFMMVALGASGFDGELGEGYTYSMAHLFTHAFFKALLFLGAGAVIHAVHSNEMGRMGSLRKYMPITHVTFLVACLSISGMPPFSGFFSKDGILAAALLYNKFVFAVLLLTSGLTAFYMFRLYFRVFWGADRQYEERPHEAPASMTAPLVILALLTCVTGFVPFSFFLSPDLKPYDIGIDWAVASASIGVGAVGIIIAMWFYRRESGRAARVRTKWAGFWDAAYHRFYIDEVWMFVTNNVIFRGISKPVAWFDRHVVDGTMNLLGTGTEKAAGAIKGAQSGKVQTYAIVFVVSVMVITILVLAF